MPSFVTQPVLICALVAAIFWNLLTWWFGMPSSSTHALVGSLVGAALAAAVCMNAAKPLTDKEGKPVSVWTSDQMDRSQRRRRRRSLRADPAPEVLAALGDEASRPTARTRSSSSGQEGASGRLLPVASGEIVEKEKTEKAGMLHKVVIPMVTSPLIGFRRRVDRDGAALCLPAQLAAGHGEPRLRQAATRQLRLHGLQPRHERRHQMHGHHHAGPGRRDQGRALRRASRTGCGFLRTAGRLRSASR